MNKKEQRKILRKFCSTVPMFQTFDTEQQGLEHLEAIRENWNYDMIRGNVVHCTVCGSWHILHEYNKDFGEYQYPNLTERSVILNAPYREKDYIRKRTKHKMLGRFSHVMRFPKQLKRFGEVPDDGFFEQIVSQRFICFNCRKSWRRHPREQRLNVCPQCAKQVYKVYPMFRAPKRKDIKEWEKLERKIVRKEP